MSTSPRSNGNADSGKAIRTHDLMVLALLVAFAIAGFVFRDLVGLVVLAILVVATLFQLARVLFFKGKRATLMELLKAIRDILSGL